MAETTEEAIKRHERWLLEQEEAFNRHRSWAQEQSPHGSSRHGPIRVTLASTEWNACSTGGCRRLGALEEQVRRVGEMLERYLGHRGGDGRE